jgi:hypothetical protein
MRRAVAIAVVAGALGSAALAVGVAGQEGHGAAPARGPAPSGPPPAEAHGRSAAFVIVSDTPSGAASVTLAPGEQAPLGLRVANASGSARTFALRASAPWLTVPARVSVPPRQSVPVAATVRLDDGAAAGVLRAEVAASTAARPDARLAVVYESRVRVRVRVVAP